MTDVITPQLQKLASEAFNAFTQSTRQDGETKYVHLKDERPDWLQPIVYAAHGDLLPDDWKYDCIWSAFGAISDASEDEDISDVASEFADGHVDVYNSALFDWLASNLQRQFYVDEAVKEFGQPDEITKSIALGQYAESEEVFYAVVRGLDELVDEDEEEDNDD